MIPPPLTMADERSTFTVKRRTRKKSDPGEEPAITILPPEPKLTAEFFRSSSPGVYKAAPSKAANSKGVSSFVILGEMLNTPVQSRPASPSGRVSPFRGHGFKSPAVSRAPSPEQPKPVKKSIVPKKSPAPRYKTDIGLPPKSPKRVKPRPPRNPIVQKTNLGIDNKSKPNKTPRPARKPLAPASRKNAEKTEETVIAETRSETDMNEVSDALNNLVVENKVEEKTEEPEAENQASPEKEPVSKGEGEEMQKADDKPAEEVGTPIVDQKEEKPELKKESEKLIPCFQPDKCQIAPPTMASPSPIIASAINAPSTTSGTALTKTTESIETAQASTVTTTSLTALSSAVTISGNLAKKSYLKPNLPVSEPKADHKEEESHQTGATTNGKAPKALPEVSLAMAPYSNLTVPDGNKVAGATEEVLSTTNLIKGDSDLELLSANSLRDSPPRRQPNPAWNEERLLNGDVPSVADNRSKFRRFLSMIWRVIKFILCCRCFVDCCRRAKCSKCDKCNKCNSKCCYRSRGGTASKSCCLPCSNCCGKSSCGKRKCRKPKCCDGCCKCRWKKKPPPAAPEGKRAKMNYSCKDCCGKVKTGFSNCGGRVNNFCRSLFCLNMMCCQRCLRKGCKSCHKLKCCQTGGCCSCFNPSVKRAPKLDKRASTQSRTDKSNLDAVLVEHVSLMKAAIPVLPICLAVLCLVLNLVFPGSGTFMSGIFCLCFGKPRFSVKDSAKNRIGSFCVNLIIGIAQLFTIIFCLVGWGWSIWWGVIMYRLARRGQPLSGRSGEGLGVRGRSTRKGKYRRIRLAEKSTEEANNSANHNHVDVEKG